MEFKEGWNPEAIVRSLCTFANDFHNWGGGYLVIGVAEKDGQPILPPQDITAGQADAIQKNCWSWATPRSSQRIILSQCPPPWTAN